MLGSFPLGMFRAILLRLNLRVADSKRSPGHLWGVYAFSRIPYYLPFTVGVISIYTQSKINKDDTQHSAASHFLPCQRWTLSPWQTWLFKFMLLLLVLFFSSVKGMGVVSQVWFRLTEKYSFFVWLRILCLAPSGFWCSCWCFLLLKMHQIFSFCRSSAWIPRHHVFSYNLCLKGWKCQRSAWSLKAKVLKKTCL